jgi:hypothetical protein
LEGRVGAGVLETESEPLLRPMPRPTPRAMAMTRRHPPSMNQIHFLLRDKKLLDFKLDSSGLVPSLPGYSGGVEIEGCDIWNAVC